MVAKKFDISSVKGLRSAEKYQNMLLGKFDNVKVETVGFNKIIIKGYD